MRSAIAATLLVFAVILAGCGVGPSSTQIDSASEPPISTNSAPRPSPTPLPTPHPEATHWVEQRLDAVVAFYQPTIAGEQSLPRLDCD